MLSEDSDFYVKSKIYDKYLIDCGHNSAYINRVFEEVGAMTRAVKHAYLNLNPSRISVFLLTNITLGFVIIDADEWDDKSFSSAVTGRSFNIRKTLMCTSVSELYLAHCVACGLQGVGSTHKFKPRWANYKSHIKLKRRTCGVVNHVIDVHGGSHSNLKFMLIDSNIEDLRKCENFRIRTLLTNLGGLNTGHDYSQQ